MGVGITSAITWHGEKSNDQTKDAASRAHVHGIVRRLWALPEHWETILRYQIYVLAQWRTAETGNMTANRQGYRSFM